MVLIEEVLLLYKVLVPVLLYVVCCSLPDDDTDYSVFDFYVDESGEWDVWQSR